MNKIGRTVSSLEISEWVERSHKNVLRDIRTIIEHLEEGQLKSEQTYFIESNDLDSQGKERPVFLLTKKGCELYGTRMNGAKGTQFAYRYIERFNELERNAFMQVSSNDPITLALEVTRELHERFNELERVFKELKENMRISSSEEFQIKQLGKLKVIEILGGYETENYKKHNRKIFSALWTDFKNHFLLPRHSDLPQVKLNEAKRFIKLWTPDKILYYKNGVLK